MDQKAEVHQLNNGDIVLCSAEDKVISQGDSDFVKTGINLFIPEDHCAIFLTISTMFINNGVYIHPAKINMFPEDTGELMILLKNDGIEDFIIPKSSPIAVMKIIRSIPAKTRINGVKV